MEKTQLKTERYEARFSQETMDRLTTCAAISGLSRAKVIDELLEREEDNEYAFMRKMKKST